MISTGRRPDWVMPQIHERQNACTLQQHVELLVGADLLTADVLREFETSHEDLVETLTEVHLEPSVMQMAVAVSAYQQLPTAKRQIWSQPPGTGKTRTLLSLIYLLAVNGEHKDIVVRFSSKLLYLQDRKAFKDMQAYVQKCANVHLEVGFKNVRPGSIELYDEADSLILDDPRFDEHARQVGSVIGLTATPLNAVVSQEKSLLSHLGFTIKDSRIPPMSDETVAT